MRHSFEGSDNRSVFDVAKVVSVVPQDLLSDLLCGQSGLLGLEECAALRRARP